VVAFDWSGPGLSSDDELFIACPESAGGPLDCVAAAGGDRTRDVAALVYNDAASGVALALCDDGEYRAHDRTGANVCTGGTGGVEENIGSPGGPNTCVPPPVPFAHPAEGKVAFSEVMAAPDGGAEWLELYVLPDAGTIDLVGCELRRPTEASATTFRFPDVVASRGIAAGAFLLLASADAIGEDAPPPDLRLTSFSLPNSEAFTLTLVCIARDGTETTVDDALIAKAVSKHSTQLSQLTLDQGDPAFDNDLPESWCTAADDESAPAYTVFKDNTDEILHFGTPGAPNLDCPPPPVFPPPGALAFTEVFAAPVSNFGGEWVELYNAGTEDYDVAGCLIVRIPDTGNETDWDVTEGPRPAVVPGQYVLVASEPLNIAGEPESARAGLSLPNDGEVTLELRCDGQVVDRVRVPEAVSARSWGLRPERIGASAAAQNDTTDAWCLASSLDKLSPAQTMVDGKNIAGALHFATPGRVNVCGSEDQPDEVDRYRNDSPFACTCEGGSAGDGVVALLAALALSRVRRRRR
jgi:hypothetical protein